MYNIQVYVPYEKQQYIKKMNHYITSYPYIYIYDFMPKGAQMRGRIFDCQ